MNIENVERAISALEQTPVRSLISPREKAFVGGKDEQLFCPIVVIVRSIVPETHLSYDEAASFALGVTLDSIWGLISLYDSCFSREAGRTLVLGELRHWCSGFKNDLTWKVE